MKSGGRAVFMLGAALGAIVLIWGAVGFYVSAVPVMLLLAGTGIALMAIGSKMNKDKEPNKAVQWQPTISSQTAIADVAQLAEPPIANVPWALIGPNGARYQLAPSSVVGREPGSAVNSITVAGADTSMSKAHAVVTVSGDVVSIRDLGSTNGTFIVTPEGVEIQCAQDRDTIVSAGSTIELGNSALALVATQMDEDQ